MKVLKDNYSEYEHNDAIDNKYPKKLVCEDCDSELEYDEHDIYNGEYGCAFVHCPLCGCENYLNDEEHDINLNMKNVEFPTHYAHISKETGAVDCCNNETIKEYIREAVNYFRKNKDEDSWYCFTGNLAVVVFKYEGDANYWVIVSDNYYDTYISFESEDYETYRREL